MAERAPGKTKKFLVKTYDENYRSLIQHDDSSTISPVNYEPEVNDAGKCSTIYRKQLDIFQFSHPLELMGEGQPVLNVDRHRSYITMYRLYKVTEWTNGQNVRQEFLVIL